MYINQIVDELNNILNSRLKDLDMSTSLYMIKREIIKCVDIWYNRKRIAMEAKIQRNQRNKRSRDENHDTDDDDDDNL